MTGWLYVKNWILKLDAMQSFHVYFTEQPLAVRWLLGVFLQKCQYRIFAECCYGGKKREKEKKKHKYCITNIVIECTHRERGLCLCWKEDMLSCVWERRWVEGPLYWTLWCEDSTLSFNIKIKVEKVTKPLTLNFVWSFPVSAQRFPSFPINRLGYASIIWFFFFLSSSSWIL